ncbi:MAG: MopE-related protein [Flavobacteriales bacterium]|nr:MopE-related protein [Flavobacteriales bacterium]
MKTFIQFPNKHCVLSLALLCGTLSIAGAFGPLSSSGPGPADAQRALSGVDRQFFIENKGQWPQEVLYLARLGGLNAWITRSGVVYDFYQLKEKEGAKANAERPLPQKFEEKDYSLHGHVVRLNHTGAGAAASGQGQRKQQGYYNYFLGNDPSKWASEVGLYQEAVVKDLYPGIDLRWYYDKGSLRYDYVVAPGADPGLIRLHLEGHHGQAIRDNQLVFTTRFGEVQLMELLAYQETESGRVPVPVRWAQKGRQTAFELAPYDRSRPLIIDPLIYSTFIGGTSIEIGYSITLDPIRAYITGSVLFFGYPTTTGAYDTSPNGFVDVFITKLDPIGSSLMYSTYLGGSGNEEGLSIVLDSFWNAYVTGYTKSSDFPVPTGYDGFLTGTQDAFVTKLNPTGTALVYSTYLGGSGEETGHAIALGGFGLAYVTGKTNSSDFPIASGYDSFLSGSSDAFVTKFNNTGTGLMYSTYLGGSGDEVGYGIAVDGSGSFYVTGQTQSSDFPATPGAHDISLGGPQDIFVTKFHSGGLVLLYSTFIGGSDFESGYSIALDGSGAAYVTGYTESSDYPTVIGSFDETLNGSADAIVSKLNPAGSALEYSTYIGGTVSDGGYSIFVDASGEAYVTGAAASIDFPTTTGADDESYNGNWDVFVSRINSGGTNLIYSTYLGGSNDDWGYSIGVLSSGKVLVTGKTNSSDYPTTGGVWDDTYSGGAYSDVFVTSLDPCNFYTFYQDSDGDNHGNPFATISACTAPPGYVWVNTDCDDTNPSIFTGATETCNGVDDDCDGNIDDGVLLTFYEDADGDGYGNILVFVDGCTPPPGYVVNNIDCNDSDPAISPAASEVCNFTDDDCDGITDEGLPLYTFYYDADGDGYGDASTTTSDCAAPPGYVSDNSDCDDAIASVNPGATENFCNGLDDNCNGSVDEGAPATTVIQPSDCGVTATSPGQVFRAVNMTGATQYEFEFFDGSNYYYELRPNRGFYFTLWTWDLPSTTYSVRVRWFNGSVWSCWGPVCSITTAPLPTTQLQPGDCGVTVTSASHVLRANNMIGATQYEFEFNDGVNTYYELRPNRGFYFSLFSWPVMGTTYTVRVRWYNGTSWSPWGAPCAVTYPMFPTQLQPGDCGAMVTSLSQVLRATSRTGATQYEFKLSDGSNTWYLVRPNRGFYLSLFGLPPGTFTAGVYTVEVRWKVGSGPWSAWGPVCNITLPTPLSDEAETVAENTFDVQAFPVPFHDVVHLTVETFSEEPVHITVLDIQGRVIENRQEQMLHNGLLSLGENWASGVYMIRLQQGAELRTLRVVKTSL